MDIDINTIIPDTIELICVLVKFVVAEFKGNEQENHEGCGHGDGKSRNIYEGIRLVVLDISDEYLEMILKHLSAPINMTF
jgi:hypothetical protein